TAQQRGERPSWHAGEVLPSPPPGGGSSRLQIDDPRDLSLSRPLDASSTLILEARQAPAQPTVGPAQPVRHPRARTSLIRELQEQLITQALARAPRTRESLPQTPDLLAAHQRIGRARVHD